MAPRVPLGGDVPMKRVRWWVIVPIILPLMGAGITLNSFFTAAEIAAPSAPAAGSAGIYPDSTSHTWKVSNNGGGWFDIITSNTGGTLYCLLTGCTLTGQFVDTKDPASTAFTDGSIIANPATCGANEILMGAGVNGTRKASLDCEGDIVGVKADLSGLLTGTAGAAFTTAGTVNISVINDARGGIENLGSTTCPGLAEGPAGAVCVEDVFSVATGGTTATMHIYSTIATDESSLINMYVAGTGTENLAFNTGLPSTIANVGEVGYTTATGTPTGLRDTVYVYGIGKVVAIASSAAGAAGTAAWKFISNITGTAVTAWTIDGLGNLLIDAGATRTRFTCTLDGASPSKCPNQTVNSGAICTCTPVGTTAAIAATNCIVSLSSTTLTVTSVNGATNNCNCHCL